MTTTRTDHTAVTASLRSGGSIEEVAASDLLELHDSTGLNLHQAPRLLEFVEKYAAMATGDEDFRVEPNDA